MVRLSNNLSPEYVAIKKYKLATITKTSLLASTALLLTLGGSDPAWSAKELNDVGDFSKIARSGYREVVNGTVDGDGRPAFVPSGVDNNDEGHNSYSWSQAWYDDDGDPASSDESQLYVGTVRDVICAAGLDYELTGPCEFNQPSDGGLIDIGLPFSDVQRAEFWRYNPSAYDDFGGANGDWVRVFQSPMDGFMGQTTGNILVDFVLPEVFADLPRDVGYRNQSVCRTMGEPGRDRLYATTSGIPGNVLVINDAGNSFDPAPTGGLKADLLNFLPAEFDLGGIMLAVGGTNDGDIGYRGLACFNGYLITSPASSVDSQSEDVSENPFLLGNADPSEKNGGISSDWITLVDFRNFPSIDFNRDDDFDDPNDCTDCGTGLPGNVPAGDPSNYGAFDMIIMNHGDHDDLMIAVSNRGKNGGPDDGGVELWRGDGSNFGTACTGEPCDIVWNKVIDAGAGRRPDDVGPDVDNALGTFGILNGELYMGLWESGFESGSLAEMIRITPNDHGDETWELLIGGGRLDYAGGYGTATGEMICQSENQYEDLTPANGNVPGDGSDCYPSSGRNMGFGSVQTLTPGAGGAPAQFDNDSPPDPENAGNATYFWRFGTHPNIVSGEDELFMGTFEFDSHVGGLIAGGGPIIPNTATGGFTFVKTTETDKGDSWFTVNDNGLLNPFNYGVRSMLSTVLTDDPGLVDGPGNAIPEEPVLFVGTANPFTNVPDFPGTEDFWGGTAMFMGTFDFGDGPCTVNCLAGPPVPVVNTAQTFIFGDALTCDSGAGGPGGNFLVFEGTPVCVDSGFSFLGFPVPGPIAIDGSDSYDLHGGSVTGHEWFDDVAINGTSSVCDDLTGADSTDPVYNAALPSGQLKGTGDGSGEYDITLRVQDDDFLYTCKSIHIIVSSDLPPTAEITEAYIPYPSDEVHIFSLDGDPVSFALSGTCSDPYVDGNDNPPYNLDRCTWSSSAPGALDDPNALSTTATLPVSAEECQTFPGFGTFCNLVPEQITLTARDNPNGFTGSETLDVYVYSTLNDGDTETDMVPICQNGSFSVLQGETLVIDPVDVGELLCTDPDGDDSILDFNLSGSSLQNTNLGTVEETSFRKEITYTSTGAAGADSFRFRAQTNGTPQSRPRSETVGVSITVVPADATIDISKSVLSGPQNTGNDTWTVTYQITATNSGVADGSYDIIESIVPGIGITVSTTTPPTITYDPSNTDTQSSTEVSPFLGQPGDAPELVVNDETIAGVGAGLGAAVVETWTVTVVYDVDKELLIHNNTGANCTDPTDATGGSGFTNIVTTDVTDDDGNNKACAWLPLPDESDILDFLPAIISAALQNKSN